MESDESLNAEFEIDASGFALKLIVVEAVQTDAIGLVFNVFHSRAPMFPSSS